MYYPLSRWVIKLFFFTHLKLRLATATHNFKWVKITHTGYLLILKTDICKLMSKHLFYFP